VRITIPFAWRGIHFPPDDDGWPIGGDDRVAAGDRIAPAIRPTSRRAARADGTRTDERAGAVR
jgi:hypothetical protein